uniref:P12 family lipoprotein n=1 Tax=Borreliella tanukii TaxID=56146 RepID=UPI003B228DFC
MRKNLSLYALLMMGFMSCNLDSKLSADNKEQQSNNIVKKVLNSVQEDALNNSNINKDKKKDFVENFREQKYEDLAVPMGPVNPTESKASSESLNNTIGISNTSIGNTQKKEIKQEDLIPSTNEEQRADRAIKNIETILDNSKFSDLIKTVDVLKDEYDSIRADFNHVMGNVYNQRTSLIGDYKNNKDTIKELTQLQSKLLKIYSELDGLINNIDMAESEINSAALLFDNAKESLKKGIIKRLESSRNTSYSLQLSRQAFSQAQSALRNLEAFLFKRIEAMAKKKEIEEFIKHAKTVLVNLNA